MRVIWGLGLVLMTSRAVVAGDRADAGVAADAGPLALIGEHDGCPATATQLASCKARGRQFVWGKEPRVRCLGMPPRSDRPEPPVIEPCECYDPIKAQARLEACAQLPSAPHRER
jgi:hypothetical protein